MTKKSSEFGEHKGLGWVGAEVKKFPIKKNCSNIHMGWNNVKIKKNDKIFKGLDKKEQFYFANSYYVKLKKSQKETSSCKFSLKFTSSIEDKNLLGVQFHPEKSQIPGLMIYKNFIENYAY